jgi:hypothetical protein
MKKRNIYIGLFAIALSISGCSESYLDLKNYGAYDDFNSPSKVNWYIAGLYDYYFYGYNNPGEVLTGSWTDRNNLTEEAWGISTGSKTDPTATHSIISDLNSYFMSGYFGSKLGSSPTNNAYTRIRNCNILLRDIDGSDVSQEIKNQAKGQALFMRAMQLFDLVRTYGPVPIVTTVISAEVLETGLPRASVTKCVDQILKDLNQAAQLLPAKWGASDYGRLTSVGALAYKSRVLLTYASPIFNKDWDNPQNERWQKALKATEEARTAIEAAGYGLSECSNAAGWATMMSVSNNTYIANKEALIIKLNTSTVTDNSDYNGWENSARLSSQGGGGGVDVPVELIDAFPMADGTAASVKVADNVENFLLNRDPRFYRTFAFSGVQWGYKEAPKDIAWTYRWLQGYDSKTNAPIYIGRNLTESPVVVRKMTSPTASSATLEYSGTSIYEYRFAELVLNLAECYAATGNISKALSCIGEIRGRVGIPSANNYGLGNITDRHAAIAACLKEREIELAYEGKRSWDLWRWLLYDGGQDSDLKLSTTNTCTALGIPQLNGTHRTSLWVVCKNGTYTMGTADPLATLSQTVSANPDDANFQTQLQTLVTFWNTHFEYAEPTSPGDKDSKSNAINILWKGNYYINGLDKTVLDNNSWLGQTVGWGDQNGNAGTIVFQDDESLTEN